MSQIFSRLQKPSLPTLGIFAFALASVWSLYQLFTNSALHPTPLYCVPAALVEFVTAWLAYQAVESVRKVTRSNISKQDRRFAWVIFALCVVLAVPTLAVSFTANRYEFQGHKGLALLFPTSCIACAVASVIPHVKAQVVDSKLAEANETIHKLRGTVRELERTRTELERYNTELDRKLKSRTMLDATRTAFDELCAGLNGDSPASVREAAKLLNDAGYYAPADSTLRSWL